MTEEEIRQTTIVLTGECLNWALKLKLIKRPKTFIRKFQMKVKRTACSWGGIHGKGGEPRITLSLDHLKDEKHFTEYSHIEKHKIIGGFKTDNPMAPKMALIAHELAHAIDRWNKDTGWGAHKDTWRFIYGQLRRNWVNPVI